MESSAMRYTRYRKSAAVIVPSGGGAGSRDGGGAMVDCSTGRLFTPGPGHPTRTHTSTAAANRRDTFTVLQEKRVS
jgi:hypothetical protein